MKDKPSFDSLPASIQERLLWDMELDYDSSESSKAEAIHMIMVGDHCNQWNKLIIQNYYKALIVETLVEYLGQEQKAAEQSLAKINRMLTDLIHEFGKSE